MSRHRLELDSTDIEIVKETIKNHFEDSDYSDKKVAKIINDKGLVKSGGPATTGFVVNLRKDMGLSRRGARKGSTRGGSKKTRETEEKPVRRKRRKKRKQASSYPKKIKAVRYENRMGLICADNVNDAGESLVTLQGLLEQASSLHKQIETYMIQEKRRIGVE